MPAPSDFLSALGAAFMGYGKDQSLRDASDDRDAAAAEKAKKDAADAQNKQEQRYLQGFRQGTAPNVTAINSGSQLAAGFAGLGAPAPQTDPNRFQQITPSTYLDTTETPEAQQQKRATAADVVKQANEAKAHRAKVQGMVGVTLPNGQTITPQIAEAMLANPSLGGAFAKVPAPEKNDPIQIVQGVGPDGKPTFFRVNKQTGESTPVDGMEPRAPGVTGTGVAQQRQALMMSAMAEARLADARMRKYEDSLLDGSAHINPLQQAGGTLATNLSGTHGVLGSLMQAGSEGALNLTDKRYMQYVRDAQAIGRAESMVMPRGGNEAMVRSNSVLARAGTEAGPETIDAARMARQALFGPSGGIAQTMTPSQTQKLETGVAKISAGDHGSSKPSLHDRVQQLKAQGLSKAAAMVQLQHEGYDLHGGE